VQAMVCALTAGMGTGLATVRVDGELRIAARHALAVPSSRATTVDSVIRKMSLANATETSRDVIASDAYLVTGTCATTVTPSVTMVSLRIQHACARSTGVVLRVTTYAPV